jgi:hypothetical protein
MADTTDPLVLDLVEWIAREPRLYSEVIEAWRTSCPRLTIWEDAVDRGYVARQPGAGVGGENSDHARRRKIPARARPRRLIMARVRARRASVMQIIADQFAATRNARH